MKTEELERLATERPITVAEATEACSASGEVLAEVIEELSLSLARRYLSDQASFAHCDTVISNLSPVILLGSERGMLSDVAWSIYLAFDEGEHRHTKDVIEIDPQERYTRPMLKKLLEEVKGKKDRA